MRNYLNYRQKAINDMKIIVIGTSLSGKTTLVRYIRSHTEFFVSEIDEELTERNHGIYPIDNAAKNKVLAPKIITELLKKENIIFFSNTDYFTFGDIKKAKRNGFTIVQLFIDLEGLKKRNQQRIANEQYNDMNQWLEGMLQYQLRLHESKLVDIVIDSDKSTGEIAKELISIATSKNSL